MICFAKPGLAEDLYIVQKGRIFNNMLYVRYAHLTKAKHIHERTSHKDYDRKGSVAKKISVREPESAWRQDEVIGRKPPVVK
jgi:hypothetical protein